MVGEKVGGAHQQPVQGEALLTQVPEDVLFDAMDCGRGEVRLPLGIGPGGRRQRVEIAQEGLGHGAGLCAAGQG